MMKEKAILIGLILTGEQISAINESLNELKELSETAGSYVIDSIILKRKEIDPKYFIGRGKVDEIKSSYSKKDISLLIFNNELSLSQIRNLENRLKFKVITRTELILDIFAMHAHSNISKLQVELARLSYELPRIMGKGTTLSRLGGGIGTRGPGEKKLEFDRRFLQRRIYIIKKRLLFINKIKKEQRKKRQSDEFKIAIIGYTNSGKSTLFRRLTKARVIVADKLFATLDTTTRKLWLGFIDGKPSHAVITDTVGFIRDLPPTLIESFKSTLEDTIKADLLIHLIDMSSGSFINHKEVVNSTLFEIGASSIPILNCFNKIDLLTPEKLLEYRLLYSEDLFISAEMNLNIEILLNKIHNYYKFLKIRKMNPQPVV